MSPGKVRALVSTVAVSLILLTTVPAQELYTRGAPPSSRYWLGAADASLPNAHSVGALGNGIVTHTGGTPGVYAGTSCTSMFLLSLSAAGVGSCGTLDDLATGTPADGDILVRTSTGWTRLPLGAVGKFLRVNTSVSPKVEWAIGPNVSDQDADVTNSSNVTPTNLTDMVATPAADTWVRVVCTGDYASAATTTGIFLGMWANNVGATAPPQYMNVKYTVGGNAAAGTFSATSDLIAYTTTHATLVGTAATNAANVWYKFQIEATILTHATDSAFVIWPIFRSEVNLSGVTIKESSRCDTYVLHVDS